MCNCKHCTCKAKESFKQSEFYNDMLILNERHKTDTNILKTLFSNLGDYIYLM